MLPQGYSASKPQVYMSEKLAGMTDFMDYWEFCTGILWAQGLVFFPCKLWNAGVEGFCENVNCLAI